MCTCSHRSRSHNATLGALTNLYACRAKGCGCENFCDARHAEAAIPVSTADVAKQADGSALLIDRSKCFFPARCPGCSNCDRFVAMDGAA
jgi:hypothetical protein